jgi:hypothetical protein
MFSFALGLGFAAIFCSALLPFLLSVLAALFISFSFCG